MILEDWPPGKIIASACEFMKNRFYLVWVRGLNISVSDRFANRKTGDGLYNIAKLRVWMKQLAYEEG